ncbi:MAG: LysR family transcriptional regulator [Rhodanobacter sp.]|nr:MAG: LysR family transcriptional regulator [Rhodanobacter sp.]TAM04504.1 MAG: LysR family transcriptional regulator [Rhodanobacter sp.]TAM39279.1 MAG: LysR family transcriptional regulator [Rhodanobacter sp.]TAN28729.1 MAG: LysR family transcriptional regulator [Rhodanobacter sp.]
MSSDQLPRLPKFEMRQARAFLAVAAELHFRRAADRLFTSQPALSRSIRALERAVGTPLLERSTRRVRLTSAGEAFASECRTALSHFDRAETAALDAVGGRGGRLRLGYMNFAISGGLPALLQSYQKQYPRVVMDLEYAPSAQQRVAVLQGTIDIGFTIGELRSQKVRNFLFERNDFVALLPSTHPLSARPELRLSDLAGEPFVLGTEETFSTFRRLLFPACHNAGFFPNIVQQASNSTGIFGMVAAGVGVSVYAGCARSTKMTGVVVKPLVDVEDTIPTFAIWAADNSSEVLHGFTTFLESYACAHPIARGSLPISHS